MSFFNKILASVGVGNSKVDTKLSNSIFTAGNTISGVTEVTGGHTSQEIESIYLKVFTTYERESNDSKYTDSVAFFSYKLNEPFTIQKDEMKSFPFSFNLPLITPVTMGKTRVWIQTSLDIKNSVDPGDKDLIEIPKSHPIFSAAFDFPNGSIFNFPMTFRHTFHTDPPPSIKSLSVP